MSIDFKNLIIKKRTVPTDTVVRAEINPATSTLNFNNILKLDVPQKYIPRTALVLKQPYLTQTFKEAAVNSVYIYSKNYVKICFFLILQCRSRIIQVIVLILSLLSQCLTLKYLLRDCSRLRAYENAALTKKLNSFNECYTRSSKSIKQLKEIMGFTDRDDSTMTIRKFIAMRNREIFVLFKKYSLKTNALNAKNIKIPKPIQSVTEQYYSNLMPLKAKFEFFIQDSNKLRYDSTIVKQPHQLHFNAVLAQPLKFNTALNAPPQSCSLTGPGGGINFFNNQVLSAIHGECVLPYTDSRKLLQNLKSPAIENHPDHTQPNYRDLIHQSDLYLPNFTKKNLPYSPGIRTALNNSNSFTIVTDRLPFPPGNILTLDQRIRNHQKAFKVARQKIPLFYEAVINSIKYENDRPADMVIALGMDETTTWLSNIITDLKYSEHARENLRVSLVKYNEVSDIIIRLMDGDTGLDAIQSKNFKMSKSSIATDGWKIPM